MKSGKMLFTSSGSRRAEAAETARPKVRRAPACEMLEGRQLMNAAWTPPQGFGGWDGAAGKDASVHVHALGAKDFRGAGHDLGFPGMPGGMVKPDGTMPVLPAGASFTTVSGQAPKAPSAQLQQDFQNLQTDLKTLRSEIPSSLTSAVKTDQETIRTALSSLTQAQLQALRPSTPPSSSSSTDAATGLTTALTEAGVSSSEISTITTDMQNLKNAYTTTDPTLQTKISADEAAISKDGGPSISVGDHGFGMPGMF